MTISDKIKAEQLKRRPIYHSIRPFTSPINAADAENTFALWVSEKNPSYLRRTCALFDELGLEYPQILKEELNNIGKLYLSGKAPKTISDQLANKRKLKRSMFIQMANLIYYDFTQQRASVVAAIQYNKLILNISGIEMKPLREKTAYAFYKDYTKEFRNTGEEEALFSEFRKELEAPDGAAREKDYRNMWEKIEQDYPSQVGKLSDGRNGDGKSM